jgi:hypothetical protein
VQKVVKWKYVTEQQKKEKAGDVETRERHTSFQVVNLLNEDTCQAYKAEGQSGIFRSMFTSNTK